MLGTRLLNQFATMTSAVVTCISATAIIIGFSVLLSKTHYDIWGAAITAPILVAVSIPLLVRQAVRDNDRAIFRIFVIGLVLKLLTGLVYYLITIEVYGGAADAFGYHEAAIETSGRIRSGDLLEAIQLSISYRGGDPASPLTSLLGTRAMPLIVGFVYALLGPTLLGGFLVFSWFGFLGSFLFYRAFRIAVPSGNNRLYALLVILLPSMLFWSSTIGKESWVLLGLGLTALGASRALTGQMKRGLIPLITGLGIASLVRIHVAALVGIALVTAMLFRRVNPRFKELRPLLKGSLIALFGVGGLVLLDQARDYLAVRGLLTEGGIAAALDVVGERTSEAGSDFAPATVRSPLDVPAAAVTTLFRPFPFEARTALAGIVAVEAAFLLAFSVIRIRSIARALKSMRVVPYAAFALLTTLALIVAFSSFANFGLLARQRVQMLPFYMALLAFPAIATNTGGQQAPTSHRLSGATRAPNQEGASD